MRLSNHYVIILPGSRGYKKVYHKSASYSLRMCNGELYIPAKGPNNPYHSGFSSNPVGPSVQIHDSFKKRRIEDHQPGLWCGRRSYLCHILFTIGDFDQSQFVFDSQKNGRAFPQTVVILLDFCMTPCNGIFVATSNLLLSLSMDSSVRFRNLPTTARPAGIPQILTIEKCRT